MKYLLDFIVTEKVAVGMLFMGIFIVLAGMFAVGIVVIYHRIIKCRKTVGKEWMMKITIPEERMDKIDFDTVLKKYVLSKELVMVRTLEKEKSCEYYYRVVLKSKEVKELLMNTVYHMNSVKDVCCEEEKGQDCPYS